MNARIPGQRRSVLTIVLVILAALAIALPGFAVHDVDFELDGNVAVDASGKVDWVTFLEAEPVTNNVRARAGALPSGYIAAGASPDHAMPDRTTYTQGSKDIDDVSQWVCTRSNNVGNKVDITNAYSVAKRNGNGDLILYFGAELREPEGNSNIGVWFLKDEDAGCVAPATGKAATSFSGEHKEGDVFVVSAFTNGGRNANISVYEWTGGDGTAGSLQSKAAFENVPCVGDGAVGAGDAACAVANAGDVPTPWHSPDKSGTDRLLPPNTFFEGGVNITNILNTQPEDECFTKFLTNTRSSQSLTASLFDFTMGELAICGSLTVAKQTDPANTNRDFDFQVVGPSFVGTESFQLNAAAPANGNPSSTTFSNVFAGTYTISEVDIPAGWDLTAIECDGGSPNVNLAAGTVTIALGAEGNVTCTFRNRLRHSIVVEKVDDGGQPLNGAAFALFTSEVGGTKIDDLQLRHDHLFCIDNLVPGTYWVRETTTPAGYEPNDPVDVTTSNTSSCDDRFDSDNNLVGTPDVQVENEPSPRTVTVTKRKVDSNTALAGFTFRIFAGHDADPDTDTALDTKTTSAAAATLGQALFENLAPGGYTVCETGAPSPADYWTAGDCQNVTVQVGQDESLTFFNEPLSKVDITFYNMTGFTRADINCEPNGSTSSTLNDTTKTLTLDKLGLGEYTCVVTIYNGS